MSVLHIFVGKVQDSQELTRLINYVLMRNRTVRNLSAIGLDETAPTKDIRAEMLYTHQAYHFPTVNLAIHWTICFDIGVRLDPMTALAIAKRSAAYHDKHQHLFGISPEDVGKNVEEHVHCLTNTISSVNGRFINTSPKALWEWVEHTNSVLVEYDLNPIKTVYNQELSISASETAILNSNGLQHLVSSND